MSRTYNHIELFAGCGGLSLGLEKAGFELLLANELSPMAAESFAYNLLKEDISKKAEQKEVLETTFWLSSKHDEVLPRLRENPLDYPMVGHGYSSIPEDHMQLKGSLLVGSIVDLNNLLQSNPNLLERIRTGFEVGEVDLVSGGPPCQSFSMAGLRRRECEKNILPWEFAKFVEIVQPKIALLENVTGILRAFKVNGESYHAWFEVAKAFAAKGYVPLCVHINARYVGVPQNRPRFIMVTVRRDVFEQLQQSFTECEKALWQDSFSFFRKVDSDQPVTLKDINYFDVKNEKHRKYFQNSFLSELVGQSEVTVSDALDDLRFSVKKSTNNFPTELNNFFESVLGVPSVVVNHQPRKNSELVQRRFRLYQVLQKCGRQVTKEVFEVLKGHSDELSDSVWNQLYTYRFLSEAGDMIRFESKREFVLYLQRHPTKKQTQKALVSDEPAPAALSIPDDACHYDERELRTLTVREMARIQSFPDSFVFRSKVTTGGKMRRFEVPQYTQVGNAVPPLLGYALGCAVKKLLQRLE